MADALEMLRRCGRHQTGERPSEWVLRETRSGEAVTTASQAYVPEPEAIVERPLPDPEPGAWA